MDSQNWIGTFVLMISKHLLIFLLFIIWVTPVSSAFNHCSGMGKSDLMPSNRIETIAGLDDIGQQGMATKPNQKTMDCHASNNCTLHQCGGYAIDFTTSTINAFPSLPEQVAFDNKSLYSAPISLDIRPPIFFL
jgi:hypothetical protein